MSTSVLQRLLERPGLHKTLGMRVVDVSPDRAVLQATVGPEICQYMGLLHGGASAALAETAACVGSCAATGLDVWPAVLETSVGHLRAKSQGIVTATASRLKSSRETLIWHVDIVDQAGVGVAVARCTVSFSEIARPDGEG